MRRSDRALQRQTYGTSHALAIVTGPLFVAGLIALCATLLFPSLARAISFDIEFSDSTYQVASGDTYADLVLEHENSGPPRTSVTLTGVDSVSSSALAGTNSNYSTLITTTFTAGVTGTYEIQVGTDWGRGGATEAIHVGSGAVLDTFVTTSNIWWANNWNNSDVFSTVLNVTAGETYSVGWVGFEDCCAGNVTFRFSVNGSAPAILDDTNFTPYEAPAPIPEPGTGLLVGLGLIVLAHRRNRA